MDAGERRARADRIAGKLARPDERNREILGGIEMASRTTLKEAQEVKAQMEARHPGRTIRIIDKSGVAQMGRLAAESKGFEIIDGNDITVTVKEIRFDILEVRKCRNCSSEILTAAIGEDGLDECEPCKAQRKARQEKELAESIERNRQSVAEWEARDRWEEE